MCEQVIRVSARERELAAKSRNGSCEEGQKCVHDIHQYMLKHIVYTRMWSSCGTDFDHHLDNNDNSIQPFE